MKSIKSVAALSLLLAVGTAQARKDCAELQAEIDAQLQAKGVKNYTLEAVATADAGDRQIVGSCDGGTRKLVYTRGVVATAPEAAAPATEPATSTGTPETPLQNY